MKRSELTAERVRDLFIYNRSEGVFTRRISNGPRWPAGGVAGTERKHGKKQGYITIKVDGVLYLAHRMAWLYVTGFWPAQNIDHRDGDPRNNRWLNLRDGTQTLNNQNIRVAPRGKKYSALFGAHWCKQRKRWKSSIRVNGNTIYLGWFESDVEASKAYLAAKRNLHEGCTI